jgi:membrane-associated protease RseP (regulator of RpoE activity)
VQEQDSTTSQKEMNLENIFAIIFLVLLTSLLYKNRKNLQVQKILWPILYFALYRTKLGLPQMDGLAKRYPRFINALSRIGVFIGVIGMFLIAWLMIKNLYDLFFVASAISGVSFVLPFKVKGGFFVPFFYWIISIFIIAVIHEFSHGVVARLHNIPVKSSGFAFLGVIIPVVPAAFVEPDDKVLAKRSRMQKLAVFAAGPFSNILTAIIFIGLFIAMSYPVASHVIELNGVTIQDYTNQSAAQLAGIPKHSTITSIDGVQVLTSDNLSATLENRKVGEQLSVVTTNGTYALTLGAHPQNSSLPYLGVFVSQSQQTKPSFEARYGSFTASIILWFMGLLYWLYLLSIGIGLFNLVPIGPIDGGQMSRELFRAVFKKEETAMKAWGWTSLFFFAIIMINLLHGFF